VIVEDFQHHSVFTFQLISGFVVDSERRWGDTLGDNMGKPAPPSDKPRRRDSLSRPQSPRIGGDVLGGKPGAPAVVSKRMD
jgi:hypothetical protein